MRGAVDAEVPQRERLPGRIQAIDLSGRRGVLDLAIAFQPDALVTADRELPDFRDARERPTQRPPIDLFGALQDSDNFAGTKRIDCGRTELAVGAEIEILH